MKLASRKPTYLETASSQPQLKNEILCPNTLSQVNH